MRKLLVAILGLICCQCLQAQRDSLINLAEVTRIEQILSADNMQGRAVFTAGIEKAADFVSGQFSDAGLRHLENSSSYRQAFNMFKAKNCIATGHFDGFPLDPSHILVFSSQTKQTINHDSGFEKAYIRAGQRYLPEALSYIRGKRNVLVLVDSSFAGNFARSAVLRNRQFKTEITVVFVLGTRDPEKYDFTITQEISESSLANIVGILPGKSKKDEYVIFSAHYDHLGIGRPNDKGDSIFNGANDDASGTTAVIMLAKYFAGLGDNERTLVFAAFTAEEIGEYGSQYFSMQFDPAKVVAMFNIEMIGTQSKWGTNSAYITGYEKTDMGKILEKNLQGSQFRVYPDPYPSQQLFYRSDNASLARVGVPAHTLSTSKMDSEKYYHTQGDEISTLDLQNMTEIIKAVAISSSSIVSGLDTPSRVDPTQLR